LVGFSRFVPPLMFWMVISVAPSFFNNHSWKINFSNFVKIIHIVSHFLCRMKIFCLPFPIIPKGNLIRQFASYFFI
jgi:hypothetical protein